MREDGKRAMRTCEGVVSEGAGRGEASAREHRTLEARDGHRTANDSEKKED
jgi:hypothetical protein